MLNNLAISYESEPQFEFLVVHPEMAQKNRNRLLTTMLSFLGNCRNVTMKHAYLDFLLDEPCESIKPDFYTNIVLQRSLLIQFVSSFTSHCLAQKSDKESEEIIGLFQGTDLVKAVEKFKYNSYIDLLICKALTEYWA